MSTVYQRKCDQCGRIKENKTGEDCTPYDPDFWWGWLNVHGAVDVWDMDGNSDLDFCSLKCLSKWAQEREKEWETNCDML